jgi:sec-independent protein translocase protein TatB
MFDIAWSELMLIGAVALVVIGPKDLPKAMRTVGQTIGKIRRMAAEFQGQFNDAMREAELHDLKKQVEDVGGSVSSSLNTDFKPIDSIKDFDASAPAADAADDAALKQAEAKLAELPAPEPLPPVDIAAETPVPDEKPKTRRKAKAEDAAAVLPPADIAAETPIPEDEPKPRRRAKIDTPALAAADEAAPARPARRRKVTEPGEGSPA